MSDEEHKPTSKLERWISRLTLGGLLMGLLAQQFWGIPYYLESKVREQVATEMVGTTTTVESTEHMAQANHATVEAIQTQLTGIETRMIERDKLFMEFLTKERERRLNQ